MRIAPWHRLIGAHAWQGRFSVSVARDSNHETRTWLASFLRDSHDPIGWAQPDRRWAGSRAGSGAGSQGGRVRPVSHCAGQRMHECMDDGCCSLAAPRGIRLDGQGAGLPVPRRVARWRAGDDRTHEPRSARIRRHPPPRAVFPAPAGAVSLAPDLAPDLGCGQGPDTTENLDSVLTGNRVQGELEHWRITIT